MNIGIAGLGLIGGSMAKALRANTTHRVLGHDINANVVLKAKNTGAIHGVLAEDTIGSCDIVIVALSPKATVDFVETHADRIKPEAVVVDCCGVKRAVCEPLLKLANTHGFVFIGGHPMAGTERWGFDVAKENLFNGASMIVTPTDDTPQWAMERVENVFKSMGFGRLQRSSPEEHDFLIAYTSQLTHVISSAYIDTDSADRTVGFSAGSFRDMTRVAHLNEELWTELFLLNADFLADEVDALIDRLSSHSQALRENDREALMALLKRGREQKDRIDELRGKQVIA